MEEEFCVDHIEFRIVEDNGKLVFSNVNEILFPKATRKQLLHRFAFVDVAGKLIKDDWLTTPFLTKRGEHPCFEIGSLKITLDSRCNDSFLS